MANNIVNTVLVLLVAILLRIATSFHSYSGENKAPMFGDYEAQRHWMEITVNLKLDDWYRETPQNNLTYWGLDYPPLTAYHMLLCGWWARRQNKSFVELHESRGLEDIHLKTFMRHTVLIVDVLIYFSGVFVFLFGVRKLNQTAHSDGGRFGIPVEQSIALMLIYPGQILIDHGHFQYNCVSLGIFLWAASYLMRHAFIHAAIAFSLALNYKQMELYHAPPFVLYALAIIFKQQRQHCWRKGLTIMILCCIVVLAFVVVWLPFVVADHGFMPVLRRLFPLSRGIFEDKVSNFWCLFNMFYKVRFVDNARMAILCAIATIVALLPSALDLLTRPAAHKLPLAFVNCSLAFYLFSFQVHEKSILLVAIPVLMYALQTDDGNFVACIWFLFISIFSMWPLFVKDQLIIATLALTTFFMTAILSVIYYYHRNGDSKYIRQHLLISNKRIQITIAILSIIGCVLICGLSLTIKPPKRYPDIFPLLCSCYSAVHFIGFLVLFNIRQYRRNKMRHSKDM